MLPGSFRCCAHSRRGNSQLSSSVDCDDGLLLLATMTISVALLPALAHAQTDADWVGKRVVQKTAEIELASPFGSLQKLPELRSVSPFDFASSEPHAAVKRDESLPSSTHSPRFYRVLERAGPRLWLRSDDNSVEGWVQAERMVPVEGAIEFFTNRDSRPSSERRDCVCDPGACCTATSMTSRRLQP